MAEEDRSEANMAMIREAESKQTATKDSIFRIQRQLAETETIGGHTLEELRKQGSQMDDISNDLDKVSAKLDTSSSLQNTFDKWAGNWWGGKKKAAINEANAEIAQRNAEEMSKVKEVFEHETFHTTSRVWKASGLYLCTDSSVRAPDLFDPASQTAESNWMIDFGMTGIDAEGWTYAYDFATLNKPPFGKPTADWNCYVRRRKWRFHEKKAAGGGALTEVKERNQARLEKVRPAPTQAEKIGYVSRAQQAKMSASGLASSSMMSRSRGAAAADQDLDEDSAAGLQQLKHNDAEINAGLAQISDSLDRLGAIAGEMKNETVSQTKKLERIDEGMTRAGDKTAVVNARQKFLLR